MPKVSICIPAYEQPKNLEKCLESISIQNFKDFEVIVTDDSKSDELIPIIDYFRNNINIKYYRNSPSKGSPENWNESIRYAKGKYIKILHHDDYFFKSDSLEKMVNLLENNPQNKILFCSSRHVDSSYNYYSSHILTEDNMNKIKNEPQILFLGNLIGAPSIMMYHRDIEIYFDKRMKWLVDLDFYIRILKDVNFVYTQDELVCINIGEENRVTYQCENDKYINIYEHILLLEKLEFKIIPLKYKVYLIKLFLKFNIKTLNEFKYERYLKELKIILLIVNILNPIYHMYKKVRSGIK